MMHPKLKEIAAYLAEEAVTGYYEIKQPAFKNKAGDAYERAVVRAYYLLLILIRKNSTPTEIAKRLSAEILAAYFGRGKSEVYNPESYSYKQSAFHIYKAILIAIHETKIDKFTIIN